MANLIPPLENLTKKDVQDLIDACVSFDAKNILGPDYDEVVSYGIPRLNLYWKTKDEFEKDIKATTNTRSITEANKVLERRLLTSPEVREKLTESNIPGKGLREEQEVERQKQEEALKATAANAKKDVEASIKKQHKIYVEEIKRIKTLEEKLKNQKINYEIQKNKIEEIQEVKNLHNQAGANSQKFIVYDVAEQFKNSPNFKGLAPEEIDVTTKQAATTLHDILTDNPESPVLQAIIAEKIVSDPKLLNKLVPNPDDQVIFRNIASVLADQRTSQLEILGQFVDISKISQAEGVVFLSSPSTNSREFNISDITSQYSNLLDGQYQLLDSLTNFDGREIKSQFLSGIGKQLDKYIGRLPANSLLASTYNSGLVQFGLSSLGVIEAAPWVAVEGSWIGNLAIASGLGHVAGFIQTKTGINLGIKLAAKTAAATAVKAGTEVVAKTGFKALIASLGSIGGPLGTALSWLAAEVVTKIVEKIPWKKILPFVAGSIAFVFFGPWIGLVVGVTTAVTLATISGATLATAGHSFISFLGIIAGAFVAIFGIPFIITITAFPIAVALILFIINSGAYIVPPTNTVAANCNLNVASGSQTTKNSGSAVANDAVCIVDDLNQFGLNPLTVGLLNTPAWQNLAKAIPAPALEALQLSAPVDGHLQCVGFAAASAGWAYGQPFNQINACSYIDNPPAGYRYFTGTSGIQSGDFFLIGGSGGCSNSSPGHIGVVLSVDGTLISCADANWTAGGQARTSNGCFALSYITGYFRK